MRKQVAQLGACSPQHTLELDVELLQASEVRIRRDAHQKSAPATNQHLMLHDPEVVAPPQSRVVGLRIECHLHADGGKKPQGIRSFKSGEMHFLLGYSASAALCW